MDEGEIYGKLADIFSEVFLRDDIVLKPGLTAKGWDSFKQIEIIIATEERFGIKLVTREIDSLKNVGDLVRVIAARTGASAASP